MLHLWQMVVAAVAVVVAVVRVACVLPSPWSTLTDLRGMTLSLSLSFARALSLSLSLAPCRYWLVAGWEGVAEDGSPTVLWGTCPPPSRAAAPRCHRTENGCLPAIEARLQLTMPTNPPTIAHVTRRWCSVPCAVCCVLCAVCCVLCAVRCALCVVCVRTALCVCCVLHVVCVCCACVCVRTFQVSRRSCSTPFRPARTVSHPTPPRVVRRGHHANANANANQQQKSILVRLPGCLVAPTPQHVPCAHDRAMASPATPKETTPKPPARMNK